MFAYYSIKKMEEEKIESNIIKEISNQDNKINNIYSNLSASEEINISFETLKPEKNAIICPEFYKSKDIFRCHLCKELLTTTINSQNENVNIDYACPNNHFGSLDIILFIAKFPSFSSFNCSKCLKKTLKKRDKLYFCKDCQEILCHKHIKECKINNEDIVSIFDLDFLCCKHNKDYNSYCQNCGQNTCEECLISKEHENHERYFFKDKILIKEDLNKINNLLKQGNLTKNEIKGKIEKTMNIYLAKYNGDISVYKKKMAQKIEEYEYLIIYANAIKKCYDLCVNLERFNHQAINNLYELFNKEEDYFIHKKFQEINKYHLYILQQTVYKSELKGIRLKDQVIKNNTNNIKVIQEPKENPKKIKIKKCMTENGEYTGEMRNSLPHGKGIYKYKNGDEYKGEFKEGMKDGNGYYKNNEGEYDGFWKEDKKDGHGKYTFKNGDLYMGEFKSDMFSGQGILLYSNGNKTIGTWENNKRNGIELLFNNKGQIFFRVYENNTLVQEKKIDGTEFIKDFKNFNQEQIMEYMSNFYIKQLKKK